MTPFHLLLLSSFFVFVSNFTEILFDFFKEFPTKLCQSVTKFKSTLGVDLNCMQLAGPLSTIAFNYKLMVCMVRGITLARIAVQFVGRFGLWKFSRFLHASVPYDYPKSNENSDELLRQSQCPRITIRMPKERALLP